MKYNDPSGHDANCAIGENACKTEVKNEIKYGQYRWDYLKRLRKYYPNSPDWFIFEFPLAQFGFIMHELLWGDPHGWEDLWQNKGAVAQGMLMLSPSGKEGGEYTLPTGESITSKGGIYTITNPDGAVVRVGRTGNFDAREGQYARDANYFDLKFNEVINSDNYAVQRGMEQILIDEYNPPMNVYNGISPQNPNAGTYFRAALDYILSFFYK